MRTRKIFNVGLGLSVLIATGLLASPAHAASGPSSNASAAPNAVVCDAAYSYTETHTSKYIGDTSTRTYGKSGGQLAISQSTAVATGSAWTVQAGVDVGTILAKVSASTSLQTSQTATSTVTTTYTWTVPSSQSTGWLEAGHHGFSVNWKKLYTNRNCGVSTVASGTNNAQTKNIQYDHS